MTDSRKREARQETGQQINQKTQIIAQVSKVKSCEEFNVFEHPKFDCTKKRKYIQNLKYNQLLSVILTAD